MSALTDLFTSLANKIRSKLGTSITYTPSEAVSAIDDVYDKGVADTKVGNATADLVFRGKTFTNSSGVGLTGTMPSRTRGTAEEATAQLSTSDNCPVYAATNYGYAKNTDNVDRFYMAIPKTGYYVANSSVLAMPYQAKSVSPSTSAQTVLADSGKLLSSVSVAAISPQNSANITANTAGRDASGAYVYFPYGWYPYVNANGCYIRPTDAQAQAMHAHTGTYTFSSGDGSTIDLGLTHSYRYVNAQAIYASGKKAVGTTNQYSIVSPSSTGTTYYYSTAYGAGYANTFYFTILSNTAGSFASGDKVAIYDVNGATIRTYDLTNLPRLNIEVNLAAATANIYTASITVQSKTVGFYFRWKFG